MSFYSQFQCNRTSLQPCKLMYSSTTFRSCPQ